MELDSYQKYSLDFWGSYKNGHFQYVKKEDIEEVAIAFAVEVSHLDYADNFRIFPLHMEQQFNQIKDKGCCGSFNSQVKCLSGNIYWIGCNYGH